MTKQLKIGMIFFIAAIIASGVYFIQRNTSKSAQAGYTLYDDGDTVAAFNYFNQHADTDPQSAFSLAMMYWNGVGTPQNKPLAIQWLTQSANEGNRSALYNLGYFRYQKDIPASDDDPYGLTSLKKAADLGVLNAQELLGSIYIEDKHKQISQDYELARHYLNDATQQDSILASFSLGVIAYQHDKDYKKAVEILEPLATDNFLFSAILLETIYREGGHGIEKNDMLAKKYEKIARAAMRDLDFLNQDLEPVSLSIHGYQTLDEQKKDILELEARAKNGDDKASYALFNKLNTGEGVRKNPDKAVEYLQPLIEKKRPKALYLHYVSTRSEPQYLIDAANANYSDAVYRLYQAYSNGVYDHNFAYDSALANKYLISAADLGHLKAIIKLINRSLGDYEFPNKKLNTIVTQYTQEGLKKYPDSTLMLMTASEVYGDKESELYNPVKSFELNVKASKHSSDNNVINELAYKYVYGIGTEKNLKKAVALFKQSITNAPSGNIASYYLVKLYYDENLVNNIDEQFIISLLKEDAKNPHTSELGHYYADYLLQQDAQKNHDLAFQLYQETIKSSHSAIVHYAKALLRYQTGQENVALEHILKVLNRSKYDDLLSEKELQEAYTILFKYGIRHPNAQNIIAKAAFSQNNAEAKALIEPLIGKDANITYLYATNKLSQISDIDTVPDNELKNYFEAIIKASELGNIDAMIYITKNLDEMNYSDILPYYKTKFMALTGLTQTDLIPWYKKCADLGSHRCLFDLGEIYQNGKYGEDVSYEKALFYYNKIDNPDFSFLKWRLQEINKANNDFVELKEKANQGSSDALYKLGHVYKVGNYGKKRDDKKWLKYLAASAKLGNKEALTESIVYYKQDSLIETNKTKILGYYTQLIALGDKEYARKLADQYIAGSRLVALSRQKAREYYQKAGDWGEYDLKQMDKFDIHLKVVNENTMAKYELGNAYLKGIGTKQDVIKAKQYYKKAAEENHEQAIYQYTDLLQKGRYDPEKQVWLIQPDWQEAIIWLKKFPKPEQAAEDISFYNTTVFPALNGETNVYIDMAKWYQDKGQKQAAEIWYRKSIEAGDLRAFRFLDAILKEEDKDAKRQLYLMGAEKGDAYSQIQLSWLYLNDAKITSDSTQYHTTIRYLNEGLKSDDTNISQTAFNTLSTLYKDGIKDKNKHVLHRSDKSKYLSLLESESTSRNQAMLQLFEYYSESDPNKALSYLQIAYEKGDLQAIERLYQLNFPGKFCSNDDFDMDKAARYLNEWLEKSHFEKNNYQNYDNNPETKTKQMGDVFLNGSCEIDKNVDNAIDWYKKSLKYNDAYALESLYKAYIEKGNAKEAYYYGLLIGRETSDIELIQALPEAERETVKTRFEKHLEYQKYGRFSSEIEQQRQQAEMGDAQAAYFLGTTYARGYKVPRDTEKMVYYFELSGKNGNADAYNILGNMFLNGDKQGIEKDAKKALYCFELGAKQNDSNTAHLAGDMLYFGQGGLEKDYLRAAKYFESTDLEQGIHHALAKYKLAHLYYNGLIGSKNNEDIQKAYDYLQLAAKYQDKHAIEALKEWDFKQIKK
ncbi:sel1 repeat family protein [Xenorhabdus bovienii]|uniref:sel1 repeat family protein n=1 Tax=Xenorhabdus bovienii TaxID=40576 RepID=UPI0023B2A3EB|nr:sel1 repeat family protein [Xenorhabdus bovienii]MDE9453738.1 sel1 repeat family protein [Xenorhabdus bovienii]MDE9563148.1 sel1 repeat family protein [Xenorhabdus bovienii]